MSCWAAGARVSRAGRVIQLRAAFLGEQWVVGGGVVFVESAVESGISISV